eukprot:4173231-Alexandrium_andersonii.AAC.1
MSASLVGSEMCIRDRPLSLASPPALSPAAACHSAAAASCIFTVGCQLAPVSYTHLTLPTICSV